MERYNKVIAIWATLPKKLPTQCFKALEGQDREGIINPVYIMADSGARGFKQQQYVLASRRQKKKNHTRVSCSTTSSGARSPLSRIA